MGTKSATRYVQSGKALLLSLSVPSAVAALAEELLLDVRANLNLARLAAAA